MQCWKCGAQMADGVCTMCGCLQSARAEAVTEHGRMLRYVYDKFGARRTLTEEGLLARCLTDMLPDEVELRHALTSALAAGVGRDLYAVLEKSQPVDDLVCKGLKYTLSTAGLTAEDARAVVVCLLDMVGCGLPPVYAPGNGRKIHQERHPPAPEERPRQEISRHPEPERSRNESPAPVDQPTAILYNVVLADATHGLNAMKSNGRSGVLFLRQEGVAMHHYEHRIGVGKKRAWHAAPDIFVPLQAIDRLVVHDSGLSYDFTLVLKDGVRFQAISSTYTYNRSDAKAFVAALQDLLQRRT